MARARYPSDLSDAQWALLEPLLKPRCSRTGRPRRHPLREVVNALLYQARNGGAWRALPHDLPPWTSVYDHFRRWKRDPRSSGSTAHYASGYGSRRAGW